jgi:hypothetical protein
LVAYDSNDQVLFQSGVVADGAVAGADEPSLELLHDQLYDDAGEAVKMFWKAAPSDAHPLGYESDLLVPPHDQTGHNLSYTLPAIPARVTARLRLQAIGLDVIDDFDGIDLPITAGVLNSYYMQNTSLRSRIRTISVPGSEQALVLQDGALVPVAVTPAPNECAGQAYVSHLTLP